MCSSENYSCVRTRKAFEGSEVLWELAQPRLEEQGRTMNTLLLASPKLCNLYFPVFSPQVGIQLFPTYRLECRNCFLHIRNAIQIASFRIWMFFGLCCLQGLHSLDSANQVEVFTEPSVCPQASDATTGVKDKAAFLFLAGSLS